MLKIRRPLGRLIFNMGIAIPGKTVFLIETAPCILRHSLRICGWSQVKTSCRTAFQVHRRTGGTLLHTGSLRECRKQLKAHDWRACCWYRHQGGRLSPAQRRCQRPAQHTSAHVGCKPGCSGHSSLKQSLSYVAPDTQVINFHDQTWWLGCHSMGPVYNQRLTEIRAWWSNYTHDFLWDVITHLCLNFNS